jgi:hypothetical protein
VAEADCVCGWGGDMQGELKLNGPAVGPRLVSGAASMLEL